MFKLLNTVFTFIIKNLKWLVWVALIVFVFLFIRQGRHITKVKQENKQLQETQVQLLSVNESLKLRDSTYMVRFGEVVMAYEALQRSNNTQMQFIKERLEAMDIKVKNAVAILSAGVNSSHNIITTLKDSVVKVPVKILNYKDKHYELHGIIQGDTLNGTASYRANLIQVAYKEPRKWWEYVAVWHLFKKRQIRQTINVDDKNSVIEAPIYIKLIKLTK